MSSIKLGVVVFSLFAFTGFVWASESDEIREMAKAMQREAAELAEQGHKEEAANLKRKAMAMLEEAEFLQHHRPDQRNAEIMEMKKLLEKLRQKEKDLRDDPDAGELLDVVRHEAKQVEMKMRELADRPHREHRGPEDDIARRLEHMRIAVDHLNRAGLHDVAEHVAQRAEAAERELHERELHEREQHEREQHERHRHQEGDLMHQVMKQLNEIRHEVGRLRDEVKELKEKR